MTREEVVFYLRLNGFVQIESRYHVNNYAQFLRPEDRTDSSIAVDNIGIHYWEMLEADDRRARVSCALKELDLFKMKHATNCHDGVVRWLKQHLGIKG